MQPISKTAREAHKRWYKRNRRVVIYMNKLRNAGIKPPPIDEARKELERLDGLAS